MGQQRNQRWNLKTPRDKWTWKHNLPKSMRHNKSSFKREVYSDTGLPQETRKISDKQCNYTPNGTRKRKRNRAQS